MANKHWEHFSHEADVGIRGVGETIEEAFEQTALALSAAVCDPELIGAVERVSLHCEASDLELLLVDWLNALVYEMAVRRMLFSRFSVHINGTSLKATAWGEAVDRERHQPAVEVKGATYTELKICRTESGSWLAQCVIDV